MAITDPSVARVQVSTTEGGTYTTIGQVRSYEVTEGEDGGTTLYYFGGDASRPGNPTLQVVPHPHPVPAVMSEQLLERADGTAAGQRDRLNALASKVRDQPGKVFPAALGQRQHRDGADHEGERGIDRVAQDAGEKLEEPHRQNAWPTPA